MVPPTLTHALSRLGSSTLPMQNGSFLVGYIRQETVREADFAELVSGNHPAYRTTRCKAPTDVRWPPVVMAHGAGRHAVDRPRREAVVLRELRH
mgnify:CR=1 FL=1